VGRSLLKPNGYGVSEDGPLVKLQIGNSVLPMTWDVAYRLGARMRVAVRGAQEYRKQDRNLRPANEENDPKALAKVIREATVLAEGNYRVFSDQSDVVFEVGNVKLTMVPEVARNISVWLVASGQKVKMQYAKDMELRFEVAQLTDGTAEDKKAQSRRDATSIFTP